MRYHVHVVALDIFTCSKCTTVGVGNGIENTSDSSLTLKLVARFQTPARIFNNIAGVEETVKGWLKEFEAWSVKGVTVQVTKARLGGLASVFVERMLLLS